MIIVGFLCNNYRPTTSIGYLILCIIKQLRYTMLKMQAPKYKLSGTKMSLPVITVANVICVIFFHKQRYKRTCGYQRFHSLARVVSDEIWLHKVRKWLK